MSENKLIKLFTSIPIILTLLYFIPFLGICLILFRYYVYRNENHYKIAIVLIVFGLLLLTPKLVNTILKTFKLNIAIPYLKTILSSDIYLKLLSYSKWLIIIGVLCLILCYIFTSVVSKVKSSLNSKFNNYIKKNEQRTYEIQKENDLKMKEKQEEAKNTHFVSCPTCGSDNILHGNLGICKHCRRTLKYDEKENKKNFDVENNKEANKN